MPHVEEIEPTSAEKLEQERSNGMVPMSVALTKTIELCIGTYEVGRVFDVQLSPSGLVYAVLEDVHGLDEQYMRLNVGEFRVVVWRVK